MYARRDTTALNSLLREPSFPQNKEKNVCKEKRRKYKKCGLFLIYGAVRRSFLFFIFFASERRKKAIDKRDRSPFELNMGSKRSAVILISYIYKNVKRERKDNPLNVFYVGTLFNNYTNGIYTQTVLRYYF